MPKLFVYRGIPGAGKTTAALDYINTHPITVRVNRDDIRMSSLYRQEWSKQNERKLINPIRDFMIRNALLKGYDVISDDTNLRENTISDFKKLTSDIPNVQISEVLFPIELAVAIERDKNRKVSVGEDVIKKFHRQYIKNVQGFDFPLPIINDDLTKIIICDIDGTLAISNGRDYYDPTPEDLLKDTPSMTTINVVKRYGLPVVLMTGRFEKYRDTTVTWLKMHGINYKDLFMRPDNDTCPDDELKYRLYMDNIYGKYQVELVIDDRNRVVNLWRRLGLVCHQVADGDF